MFSILSVLVFASKIESTVEKSFLTSARLLFGVWGSILDLQTLRELFLKVGGNFYITRAHFWRPRGHFWTPKGHFWMPRGHVWSPKGHFWISKRSLFDLRGRFWTVLEQGRQTSHENSESLTLKWSLLGRFGGQLETFGRPKVIKK